MTLTLVNDTITNGLVDLISINGDVLWVRTTGGRQMFMQADVKDLTRLTSQPESTCQKSQLAELPARLQPSFRPPARRPVGLKRHIAAQLNRIVLEPRVLIGQ